MTLAAFFSAVISAVLLLVGAVSLLVSRRQKKAYEFLAKTETFHCLRCDSVYTAPAGSDSVECPKCGYKNSRLKF